MRVELTTEEAEALRTVLERYLADLSYEIADTDRSSFRDRLRAERGLLTAVASRLTAGDAVAG